MIDRLFNLTLAFAVLLGGTLAFGSDFFSSRSTASTQLSAVTQLPRVVIIGSVAPASTTVAQGTDQADRFVQ